MVLAEADDRIEFLILICLLTDMSGQPYSLKKQQNDTTDVSQRAISFSAALSCSPIKKENCIQ